MLGEDGPLFERVRGLRQVWRGNEGSNTLGHGEQETVGEAERVASGRR